MRAVVFPTLSLTRTYPQLTSHLPYFKPTYATPLARSTPQLHIQKRTANSYVYRGCQFPYIYHSPFPSDHFSRRPTSAPPPPEEPALDATSSVIEDMLEEPSEEEVDPETTYQKQLKATYKRVERDTLKPRPIEQVGGLKKSYSDTAAYDKVIYPWPDDPSVPETYLEEQYVPATWISERVNDGQGSVAYQLQNYHWTKNNAFDLEAITEFNMFLQKLDIGDYPAAIILRGAGRTNSSFSFCTGADLKQLFKRDMEYSTNFFKTAYETSYTLATMKTLTFACIQGNTMGLGAGLCLHSVFRVATDRASWAFPNTLYGAFPDCGATWMLPRLKHNIGMYLSLTGRRLELYDLVKAGIATHYASIRDLEAFQYRTSRVRSESLNDDVIRFFTECTTNPNSISRLDQQKDAIERCFGKNSLIEIFDALNKENTDWSRAVLKRLEMCSPLMLHVTFRLQKLGLSIQSLEEALQLEFRVALHMLESAEFYEGINARVINKTEPRWLHKDIRSVPKKDIAKFFLPHQREHELKLKPCAPGLRPADPFRIYIDEMRLKMDEPTESYMALRQLDHILSEDATPQDIINLYKTIFKQGGMEKEAAEYFFKLKTALLSPDWSNVITDYVRKPLPKRWDDPLRKLSDDLTDEDVDKRDTGGAETYKVK